MPLPNSTLCRTSSLPPRPKHNRSSTDVSFFYHCSFLARLSPSSKILPGSLTRGFDYHTIYYPCPTPCWLLCIQPLRHIQMMFYCHVFSCFLLKKNGRMNSFWMYVQKFTGSLSIKIQYRRNNFLNFDLSCILFQCTNSLHHKIST